MRKGGEKRRGGGGRTSQKIPTCACLLVLGRMAAICCRVFATLNRTLATLQVEVEVQVQVEVGVDVEVEEVEVIRWRITCRWPW